MELSPTETATNTNNPKGYPISGFLVPQNQGNSCGASTPEMETSPRNDHGTMKETVLENQINLYQNVSASRHGNQRLESQLDTRQIAGGLLLPRG
mgnify:CR=1 FL=1